ncbi:MAG: hypothetical protein KKC30_06695 [Proteobacteria bacterium]|nr:hypothetical protein [Pseudomonadota bacterium]MBU4381681.1 hypothetical protein [Pseudomonadota bacterium]MCG2765635.1 hypothetical protein [Desulfarculaceae bacterium]
MNKRLVVLTKSDKVGGWCIAGRELIGESLDYNLGNWIRPVVADGPIGNHQCVLNDSSSVQVLDIVEIPMAGPRPIKHQPENYLIKEDVPWKKLGTMSPSALRSFIERPDSLWWDPSAFPEYVTPHYVSNTLINQSLYIIKPDNLFLNLYRYGERNRTKAIFTHNGQSYQLQVTDPRVKSFTAGKFNTTSATDVKIDLPNQNDYFICISLAGLFEQQRKHYKLVASIIDPTGKLF